MTYSAGQSPADLLLTIELSKSSSASSKLLKSHAKKDKTLVKSAHCRIFPCLNLTTDLFWHYYAYLLAHQPYTLSTDAHVALPQFVQEAHLLDDTRQAAIDLTSAHVLNSGAGLYVVEARKPQQVYPHSTHLPATISTLGTPELADVNACHLIQSTRHPFLGYLCVTPVRVVPTDLSFVDLDSDVAKLEFTFRPDLGMDQGKEYAQEAIELVLHEVVSVKKVIRKVIVKLHVDNAAAAAVVEAVGFKREKDVDGYARFGFGVNEGRELNRKLHPVDLQAGPGMIGGGMR
ncbi:hypothetical protein BCR44DRAFT_34540 [Catenaria anguillulae PL171]|uniref:Uncharacterized protein n=1 Tax=Catenaria anguillulae PL171 TaxID=765915 RepID=A0A1Y2I4P2_9FUNG|nr:hypothetical protein BCR44DRAFT_34540 [Catenaria anguillulae PL171]